jgi:FAD:protein FMN transferase
MRTLGDRATTRAFRAMGVGVVLLAEPSGRDADELFDAVEAEFARLEALFSPLQTDSELAQLNRYGSIDNASPELFELVVRALEARVATNGLFDPTSPPAGLQVDVDRERSAIQLAENTRLDLGGIAKGYAVEQATGILGEAGPCLVNAGGDLAVAGLKRGSTWPVGVSTPDGVMTLALESGAIATSGRARRSPAEPHLIDPRTGGPTASDVVRVTVVEEDAITAEIEAKHLFLLGFDEGVASAEEREVASVLVAADGRWSFAGGLG